MPGLEPNILCDHDDFWIIEKPIGWTIQKDASAPGLLEWLIDTQTSYAYPVHRIDKPTSGLVIVAKNRDSNRILSTLFAERAIEKTYLAISDQKPKKKQGWVKGDMKPSRRGQWKLLRSQDNPAVTQFKSEAIEPGIRGFVLTPKTGKTHQLRVAMKSLGSPILGDTLYSGSQASRVFLHASRLKFTYLDHVFSFESEPTDALFQKWRESTV